MDESAVVNSAADLSASFASLDSGTADSSTSSASSAAPESPEPVEPLSPDNEAQELPDGILEELNAKGDEETTEEAATEPAEPAVEAKPAEAAAPGEELPEGVRKGKDRNGKDGYWVEPTRWNNIYQNHQLVQKASAILGEPITEAAIDLRNKAYLAQERLYTDMMSADPTSQAQVVTHFLQEAQRALDEGEVAADPMIGFTQNLYDALAQSGSDAYTQLRSRAANDLVDEMYKLAAEKDDKALYLSAQHFDRALGQRKFRPIADWETRAERRGQDQVLTLQQENERLKAQLNGNGATTQAAQLAEFRTSTNTAIGDAIWKEAITPALESVQEHWKPFPQLFQGIQDRLHSEVMKNIRTDQGFQTRLNVLTKSAAQATSAQRRAELQSDIAALYRNKAKLVIDAVKPGILKEAAEAVKARSDQTHQRRQAAQQVSKGPQGGGEPVPRSIVPKTVANDFTVATPENLRKSMDRILNTR